MKSIVLETPGVLRINDVPLPPLPGLNEVQVRVHRVGICGTDLHAFTGTQPFFAYPRILGHELALEVLEIGEASFEHSVRQGSRSCLRPYVSCGTCGACQRGFSNCCVNMQVLGVHRDGGMREVINVPLANLHTSASLDDEDLALVEMLSIGYHAVQRARIKRGETILVIGAGPIGLGVTQFAHLAQATVIAMDVNDTRLAFARHQSGIDHVIDGRLDVPEQLASIVPGHDLPTVVIDATGNAQSMNNSFKYVAHGGRLVFVGLFQGEITFHDPDFHRRELTLLASRNATSQDFKHVISTLEGGLINVSRWITHRVSPEKLIEDFASWQDPENGLIKAMLFL